MKQYKVTYKKVLQEFISQFVEEYFYLSLIHIWIEVELKHKSNMNIAAYKGAVKNNYAKKVVPTATPAPNGTKQ